MLSKIFDISDCNQKCWECSKECGIKNMFFIPEPIFNNQIIMSLKASAGMYIASGGNPQLAENFVKKNAVARKEYLKRYNA